MGDPDDPITGSNPYAELAERIFHNGITVAELAEVATLKPGKAFTDLKAAMRQKLPGLQYGSVIDRIAEALRETVVLKGSTTKHC